MKKNLSIYHFFNFSLISLTPLYLSFIFLYFRYLATGCSLRDLHYNYRIGRSTASKIVRTTCMAIWKAMSNRCIPTRTSNEEKWRTIAEGFNTHANFPNCVGAVDGKHIRIVKPGQSGSLYFNYKHYSSVVLLAVADSNFRFVYVDVGSCGKDSDATIFRNCSLWQRLENNTLHLPKPEAVRGVDIPLPFAFVGDEAFGLSTNLLRPYSGKNLLLNKKVFNYRLSRARRYVECTFGILSNKWRIFHRPIDVAVPFAVDIVKCCVLHNFVRERDGYNFEDTLTIAGFEETDLELGININRSVNRYRNALTNYFVNGGAVPWQYSRIQ
jgi:hypothetical protein